MDKVVKAIVWSGGIIGCGYVLMKTTVPTEQDMINRLPENLQREAKERQRTSNERQQAIMDYLKEAAESDKPAWQTPDSTPKA
ncbi:hypothetical protein K492DRAFT_207184 [Lichtheimia hyalospora FSU 10163]|uniref:Cytochrome b mRNA-processing protein 4 n=1 Tax=Lichtheimia ornata TaxID=688661 RepID=A0AAD7V2D3_9FUNG|nr:uncharacterized protein O0I10_006811 [Lichtheimia ornata]KAI7880907.1 hypothetical protein K492DRAFT_207184 [Lichtheimia hyalospora FSU 10163]KAJ8657509.1 hypothetical protein O0I10_006811 [Lichtheimia ornata]